MFFESYRYYNEFTRDRFTSSNSRNYQKSVAVNCNLRIMDKTMTIDYNEWRKVHKYRYVTRVLINVADTSTRYNFRTCKFGVISRLDDKPGPV